MDRWSSYSKSEIPRDFSSQESGNSESALSVVTSINKLIPHEKLLCFLATTWYTYILYLIICAQIQELYRHYCMWFLPRNLPMDPDEIVLQHFKRLLLSVGFKTGKMVKIFLKSSLPPTESISIICLSLSLLLPLLL